MSHQGRTRSYCDQPFIFAIVIKKYGEGAADSRWGNVGLEKLPGKIKGSAIVCYNLHSAFFGLIKQESFFGA